MLNIIVVYKKLKEHIWIELLEFIKQWINFKIKTLTDALKSSLNFILKELSRDLTYFKGEYLENLGAIETFPVLMFFFLFLGLRHIKAKILPKVMF